jgi:acyl dehydratase
VGGFGRFFEDFVVGETIQHWPGKTIFESDNNLFALLTMNHHPVHLDTVYASETEHGQVLVVGTLVFSLAVGMTVADISGRAIANLGYARITHDGPVFLGDTIHVVSEVLRVRRAVSKPDRGIVGVRSRVVNQRDELVMVFERDVLVPCREE